jgi:hypothetical protein
MLCRFMGLFSGAMVVVDGSKFNPRIACQLRRKRLRLLLVATY